MTDADRARLRDMLAYARKALHRVRGAESAAIARDEDRLLAIVACMIFVGEAAAQLTEELRKSLPGMPWREAKLLRNMLVHRYFEINVEQLVATVRDDVPPLMSRLEQLLGEEPSA